MTQPSPPPVTGLWALLGTPIALCLVVGETAPKFLGMAWGSVMPEATLKAVVAPTLVGLLLLGVAITRQWNPFGHRLVRMPWRYAILWAVLGLFSLVAAVLGLRAAGRAQLADKILYELSAADAARCGTREGLSAVHLWVSPPPSMRKGFLYVCPAYAADEVKHLVSHTGHIEQWESQWNRECQKLWFETTANSFEAVFCVASTTPGSNLLRLETTRDETRVSPIQRGQLRWYEKPAFWF